MTIKRDKKRKQITNLANNDEENANNSNNKIKKKKNKPKTEIPPPQPAPELENKKNKKNGKKDKKKQKLPEVDTAENNDHVDKNIENSSAKKSKNMKGKRVITDPRFASVHFDPRFQKMPKRESKVQIDERFSRMLTDKDFARSAAPVDIRGKRKGKTENPLLHYYLQQEDGEEVRREFSIRKGKAAEVEVDRDDDSESKELTESETESEDEEEDRGEDDSDFSDSDDEDDSEDDDQSMNSDIARYLMAQHEDTPMTDEETHRLAVVNLDWDHIKAVDIYVVMSSCLPRTGQILSVTIYPSEYGRKCMDIESVRGPSGLLNDQEEHSDDDSDIVNEDFRSYELNKLRYYYAVAVFDSSATAGYVYNTLDGTELLKTSNVFDLRFIPDSMEFKHPPREIATEAPTNYKEPDFHTKALQHSKVTLTWEEDEPERKKILRRKFNPNQLDELNEYLASSTESDDVDEENGDDESENEGIASQTGKARRQKKAEKFRSLLSTDDLDLDGSGSDDKDMEITFNTDLEDLSKRIAGKKDKASETVWEEVLRKRREKKNSRKNRSKDSDDDDSSDYSVQDVADEGDDFFIEEPSDTEQKVDKKRNKDLSKNKANSNKKNKDQLSTDKLEQEASRSELELLFADEDVTDKAPKGYNLKPKKVKGKKGKKGNKEEAIEEDKLPNIDARDDPRFSALFSSHIYALDPTDPQYKRSGAYIREKHHKQIKGTQETNTTTEVSYADGQDHKLASEETTGSSFGGSLKNGNDFALTVRSLKKSIEARNKSLKL